MYERITEWLTSHPLFTGSVLAFILAMLRMITSKKSLVSQITEALTCALLSTGLTYFCIAIWHIDVQIGIFVGSLCGYLGTDNIKALVNRFLNQKISKENENED